MTRLISAVVHTHVCIDRLVVFDIVWLFVTAGSAPPSADTLRVTFIANGELLFTPSSDPFIHYGKDFVQRLFLRITLLTVYLISIFYH